MVLTDGRSTTRKLTDLVAALRSGRHYKLNTLGYDEISGSYNSLLGPTERITVPLCFLPDSLQGILPIYDTGASVSVVSQADFKRIASQPNAFVRPIEGWACSVSAANGSLLKLSGAYLIRLYFKGQAFIFAFLVSPDVTSSLFGLNLSCHYGFSFDAPNRCVYIPNRNLIKNRHTDGQPFAQAATCNAAKVDSNLALLTPLRLVDLDGKPLHGEREGILKMGPVCARFETDKFGKFAVHVHNPADSDTTLPRGHVIGPVHAPDDFRPIHEQAAAAGSLATDDIIRKRKQVRPHTPQEKAKLIDILKKQICASVPYLYRQQYLDVLKSREHAFSVDDFDLGYCDVIEHEIHFQGAEPAYTPQFRLSADHLDFLKRSVVGWLKAGVVQRTRSLHNSPIFCVEKKAPGLLRPVLDYRRVNSRSLDDRFSILTVDDCLEKIGHAGSRVFSSLDFRNSYWQLALRKSDRPYTAFTLPGVGSFEWVSCPQGLLGAPASFSRLMLGLFNDAQDSIYARSIISYIDDTLCHTRDHKSHIPTLAYALDKIIASNLRLNPTKCIFGSNSVPYLGVQLRSDGIKPGLDKVKTVSESPPPTTLRALKSVCGLFNWFRKFIFKYASKIAPLQRLTKSDSGYKSGKLPPAALSSFYRLRSEITARPILAYPNPSGKFHLYVDSSLGDSQNTGGYGAALLQEQADGTRSPVAYSSRLIAGAEANYPTTLSEWCAATYGMSQFGHYLRGKHFYLYTDHKPLARPFEKLSKVHIKTLHRLNAKAEDFHPEIRFVEGKSNACADYLSRFHGFNVAPDMPIDKLRVNANIAYITHRNASLDSLDVTPNRLRLLQAGDPEIKPLIETCSNYPPCTLVKHKECKYPITISDSGFLCVKTPPRDTFLDGQSALRIYCPASMRKEVMAAAHHSLVGGHAGNLKVAERIRDTFWWNNMAKDVSSHLSECSTCRTASNKFADPTPPLKSIPSPTSIGEIYFSDLFGPLTDEKGNPNCYVVTVTDAFSKLVRLYKVDSKEAAVVADTLYRDFSVWSPPRRLITDGGLEYRNSIQAHLMRLFGTSHRFTAIYHPQTDGTSEIFNKTLRHFLATALLDAEREGTAFEAYLPALAHSYNSSVSHATHVSPFTTHFGIKMRVPLWPLIKDELILDPALNKSGTFPEYVARLRRAQFVARQLAHDMAERSKSKNANDFNKKQKVGYTLHRVGDKCLVKRNDRRMTNQKLCPTFEPAIVLKQVGDSTYLVRRYNRKRKREVLVHGSHIKSLPKETANPHQMSPSCSSEEDGQSVRSAPPPPRQKRVSANHSPPLTRSRARSLNYKSYPPSSRSSSLSSPSPSISPNRDLAGAPQKTVVIDSGAGGGGDDAQSSQDDASLMDKLPNLADPSEVQDAFVSDDAFLPSRGTKHKRSQNSSSLPSRRRQKRRELSAGSDSCNQSLNDHQGVSDHAPSNGHPNTGKKHLFSQTSSDPLLQNLPPLAPSHRFGGDEFVQESSRDSDGFPHILPSDDSDMSSISSRGRRLRNRKKRSLPQNTKRNAKRVRFVDLLARINALKGKRRKRFYRDFSKYSCKQLLDALLDGRLVFDQLPAPRDETEKREGAASRPPSPAPPPSAGASGRESGASFTSQIVHPPDSPPSLFQADKSALRSLTRALFRAPRLLLRETRGDAASPWLRWRHRRQNRLPDPEFSYSGQTHAYRPDDAVRPPF